MKEVDGLPARRRLPETKFGYVPPKGASAGGWICDDCDESQMAFSLKDWPRQCPGCGGRLSPQLDSPWREDAYLVEAEAELASAQEGTQEWRDSRIQILYAHQGLALRDDDHLRAAELQRQAWELYGNDESFFHRQQVVWHLFFGRLWKEAVSEGIAALQAAEETQAKTDSLLHLAWTTARAALHTGDRPALERAAKDAFRLAEQLPDSVTPQIEEGLEQLREALGTPRLKVRTYKIDHLLAFVLADFVTAMEHAGNPNLLQTATWKGPLRKQAPDEQGWLVSLISSQLGGEPTTWELYAFPGQTYAVGSEGAHPGRMEIDTERGVWFLGLPHDDRGRANTLGQVANDARTILEDMSAPVPSRLLRIEAIVQGGGDVERIEATLIDGGDPKVGDSTASKTAQDPLSTPTPPTVPGQGQRASTTRHESGRGARGLLPLFPFRWVWSKRKDWFVFTELPFERAAEIFRQSMTCRPAILRRVGFHSTARFFRRVFWRIHEEPDRIVIAECSGVIDPIPIGFGNSKTYVNPNGDEIALGLVGSQAGRRALALTLQRYSTYSLFGISVMAFAFPMLSYLHATTKAIRAEDPSAKVRYPWSFVRIGLLVATVILTISIAFRGPGGADTVATERGPRRGAGGGGQAHDVRVRTPTGPFWTVILHSVTREQGGERRALRLATEARTRGLSANVLVSDNYASLKKGYWVVYSGRYEDGERAEENARRARIAGFEGAYPRRVAQSV